MTSLALESRLFGSLFGHAEPSPGQAVMESIQEQISQLHSPVGSVTPSQAHSNGASPGDSFSNGRGYRLPGLGDKSGADAASHLQRWSSRSFSELTEVQSLLHVCKRAWRAILAPNRPIIGSENLSETHRPRP